VVTVGTTAGVLIAAGAEWTLGAGLAGAVLLFAALRLGWESFRTRRRVRAVRATATTPCGHVGALVPAGVGAAGTSSVEGPTTECVGRARPGPEGVLTAPFSGEPCVWYRAATIRVEQKYLDEHGYEPRQTVESETASTAPFLLADSSGEVLVDVRGVDHAELCVPGQESFHRDDPDPRSHRREEGRHHHEWLIAPDEQLYVLGTPQLQGGWVTLARPRRGGLPLLVSQRSEDELLGSSSKDANTLTALALALGVVALGLLLFAVVQVIT
jgi:hypothetical protein